jgi:predicted nucleic acid-binding protein
LTDEIVEAFSGQLRSVAETISGVPRRFVYQRDVDDEPYITLAVEAGARYLVSRDKDLLDLMTGHTNECKEFRRRFRPLKVLDPIDFLREVEKTRGDPA